MPLHKRADGSTVSIPWPPPNVKIESRLVPPNEVPVASTIKDDDSWSSLRPSLSLENAASLFVFTENVKTITKESLQKQSSNEVIVDQDEFENGSMSWLGGLLSGQPQNPDGQTSHEHEACKHFFLS